MAGAKAGELIRAGKAAKAKRNKFAKGNKCARTIVPATDSQWDVYLTELGEGASMEVARKAAGFTAGALTLHHTNNKKAKEQVADARRVAIRRNWPDHLLEDIFVSIAMGATVKASCEKYAPDHKTDTFYRLILRDPEVKNAYDEARTIQAEKMAIDDIMEISDDSSNDETWDGKSNTAAVNRSRLMVDSRKWISGKLNFARFGDKQQVDLEANIVVDHAARLEAARKRKEATKK